MIDSKFQNLWKIGWSWNEAGVLVRGSGLFYFEGLCCPWSHPSSCLLLGFHKENGFPLSWSSSIMFPSCHGLSKDGTGPDQWKVPKLSANIELSSIMLFSSWNCNSGELSSKVCIIVAVGVCLGAVKQRLCGLWENAWCYKQPGDSTLWEKPHMFSWNLVTLKTELEKASSCTWDRSWCVFQGLCQQIKPHTLLSLDGGGVVGPASSWYARTCWLPRKA